MLCWLDWYHISRLRCRFQLKTEATTGVTSLRHWWIHFFAFDRHKRDGVVNFHIVITRLSRRCCSHIYQLVDARFKRQSWVSLRQISNRKPEAFRKPCFYISRFSVKGLLSRRWRELLHHRRHRMQPHFVECTPAVVPKLITKRTCYPLTINLFTNIVFFSLPSQSASSCKLDASWNTLLILQSKSRYGQHITSLDAIFLFYLELAASIHRNMSHNSQIYPSSRAKHGRQGRASGILQSGRMHVALKLQKTALCIWRAGNATASLTVSYISWPWSWNILKRNAGIVDSE
jgi:hypothetical protein